MSVERYLERENTIFKILQNFMDKNLNFVLIGGYAISAFKHRFSVDADIVIKKEDIKKFSDILKQKNFKKTISKELDNLYSTKFVRYEKKEELSVSFDLLVGGVGVRQTNSSMSFHKIHEDSSKRIIKGIEKEIEVRIPSKELLIALKLQAGRLTDFRDIAALSKDIDVSKIKAFLKNTDKKVLKQHINHLLSLLDKREFVDSFKGVFMEKKFDVDVREVKRIFNLVYKNAALFRKP